MTGNGWLISLLYLAVDEFNIPAHKAIWEMPMVQLMLLLRQHIYVNDKQHSGIDLHTIEQIDNGDIDRKLREKREQLAKAYK